MESLDKKEKQPVYVLILIFIVLAAGIITAGYLSYRNYANHYRVEMEHQISAIADLKVGELAQWRKERLGDAAAFYGNEAFSSLVRRYFNHPNDIRAQRQIWTWLSKIQLGSSYERLLLFDARGALRMSVPDSKEPVASNLLQRAAIVMRSEQIDFQDFYRDELDQRIYLTIMIPILSKEDGGQALGTLVLRIDPESYLYLFISRWPTPSQTAETLLARREGNEAVFLNDLRFQKDTALKLRVPLEKVELPTVRAVLGQEGLVQGEDYRGIPVIAAIRSIPDSPWLLTARMDISEVYGPLKERLWLMIIIVVALIIGIGAGIGLVWRQQHIRFYREQHEAAAALRESERRLLSITEGFPIPAFVIGKDHRILYWNRTLEKMSQIPAGEVIGTTHQWRAFYAQERPCMADLLVDEVIDKIPQWYEGKYIKSSLIDGAYEATDFFPNLGEKGLWLHFTAAVVLDSQENLFGAMETLEDITERKLVEEKLRESEELFKSYLENAPDGIYMSDLEGTFLYGNRKCEEIIGYRREELIGKNFLELNLISKNSLNKAVQLLQANMEGKSTGPDEIELISKGGRLIPVEINTNVIQRMGQRIVLASVRDITERKQAEEAFNLSQIRLSTIMDNMGDIVAVFDVNGIIIFITPSYQRILGYVGDELVGKNAFEYIHPDDREQVMRSFARAMESGSETEIFRFCHRDGQYIWLEGVGRIMRNEEGSVGGVIVGCRDITERKRAEEDLQEIEKKYRTMVETSRDLIYTTDRKGFITYMNPTLEGTLSYTHDEWNGKTFGQIVAPECIDSVRDIFKRAMRGESIPAYEVDLIRKDGTRLSVEFNVSTIYDNEGKPAGRYGIGRDITDRKQTEEALQKSEDRYRTVVENASDMVYKTDENGYFTFVNPAVLRITGYEKDEIIGKHYKMLVRPDMFKEAITFFANQLIKGIQNTYYEYPIVTKDGHELWIGQNLQLIKEEGHVTGFQAVARDITERRQMKEALEKRETMLNEMGTIAKVGGWEFDAESQKQVWTKEVYRIHEVDESYEPTVRKGIEFYAPESRPAIETAVQRAIEYDEPFDVELEIITAKGNHRWVHANGKVDRERGIKKIISGTLQDITERRQAEENIRQMAYHDSLTGLPNRKLFSDRLGIALAQAQRNQKKVGIAILDLDNFKDVNDTLGHDVGDLLLKAAAKRLSEALRKGDTVARFGGDEFVLILPDLKGIEDVIQVAQKIVDSFRQPFIIDTHQLVVTTSIGIAVYPNDGTDEGILLKKADIAMYQVKQTGRDRYQFFKEA